VRNEAIPGDLYRFDDKVNEPYSIAINGEPITTAPENGYAEIERNWKEGDNIEIDFPMPVRKVVADERIADDRSKIAIQRGPVIYCAEWPDNNSGNILNLVIDKDNRPVSEFVPSLLNGTQVIKTRGFQTYRKTDGKLEKLPEETVTLIPYALWNNRGPGQMRVWLPVTEESAIPIPTPD
jgi:hypothetical protein